MQWKLKQKCRGVQRFVVALAVASAALAGATREAGAKMAVGTNLGGINYYTTSQPFTDVMKQASSWFTSYNGSSFDSGQLSSIPLDSNGWPLSMPVNVGGNSVTVHTLMPAYTNGTYTIKTVGKGTITVSASSTQTFTAVGGNSTFTFNVTNANLGTGDPNRISMRITQSTAGDPLRNIQVLLPGYGTSTATFTQSFKDRLSIFSTIRFMDWGNTNNSDHVNWSQRSVPTSYTQGRNGVAYEYMIQLANETGKDMWVCVPHRATNDYITQLATLIKNNLNVSRKVYIEYSNEVWNYGFGQGNWVDANISGANRNEKYGLRSRQMFDLFTTAFGGNARLVRVLAGQAANSGTLDQAFTGAGGVCDAFAIAPYFGKAIQDSDVSGGIPSLDTLIGDENWSRTNTLNGWIDAAKTLANSKGKRLVCYEGGQHYVGYNGAENNQALTDQLIALNRNYRMRDYYRYTYLPAVNSRGVDLFCHFTFIEAHSKWGSWGSLEYLEQPITNIDGQGIKYWAIRDWINNAVDTATPTPTPTPTPAPSGGPKYEAESASLSGGAKTNTNHAGYSGSGFVDGMETVGAAATFTVNAGSGGTPGVIIRYCNGGGAARTLSIYVNGSKIRQTSLPATANWDTWSDKVENLTLNSGTNTIALKYDSGDSAFVNLDYIYFNAPAAQTATKYEAEAATLTGGVNLATNHSGYSGSGFVDGYWNVGATTTFTVNVSSAGTYSPILRYANGTGASRTISIYVNGVKIRQTTLANTGAWATWGDKVDALTLNAGTNTIAYKRDSTDSGDVNLDYIYF